MEKINLSTITVTITNRAVGQAELSGNCGSNSGTGCGNGGGAGTCNGGGGGGCSGCRGK